MIGGMEGGEDTKTHPLVSIWDNSEGPILALEPSFVAT